MINPHWPLLEHTQWGPLLFEINANNINNNNSIIK